MRSIMPFVVTAIVIAGLATLATAAGPAAGADAAAPNAAGQPILTAASPWRWHVTVRRPTVSVEALKAAGRPATQPEVLPIRLSWIDVPAVQNIQTEPPPDNWRAADFDDGVWPRSGAIFDPAVSVGMLCLRGRFVVADPSAVGSLTLSMKHRGGAVVYLNGREVARVDMPAGPVQADTPASPYPDEAFVGADGKAIPPAQKASADDKERMTRRQRSAGPIGLPIDALVKGVNVLAVEMHRSPFHPAALTWWNNPNDYPYGRISHWATMGLQDIVLAASGAGVEPNIVRPAKPQVWQADIHQRITPASFGDPSAGVSPIRIAAARNGVFAGQAVISSPATLKNVKAEASELAGPGKIAAANVAISYVQPGSPAIAEKGMAFCFETLTDKPAGTAVQPVWITVTIPRDAPPGDYRGTLKLSADGVPEASVPIELKLADFTLPDPGRFRTHVGIFQSPTSLALQYKVDEWSEEHWKLMERGLALLGQAGCNLVNIPVSEQTQFGNDEATVRFVRKADGTLECDLAVFDRYIELVRKHMGSPKFVALHVWHAGAWRPRPADEQNTVTVIDPKTRKRIESWQVPAFGTEASKKFWTPVLGTIKDRLAKAGLEKSMCLGILSDGTAPPEVFKMFSEILPGVGWTRGCHSVTLSRAPYGIGPGANVVYHEFCYGGGIPDPSREISPIWDWHGPGADWRRGYRDSFPPIAYRRVPERGLFGRTSGFGRLGLDFWRVEFKPAAGSTSARVQRDHIFNRYPHSSVAGHGEPTILALAAPGPDGPLPTVRFAVLREGIQEAEAMIVVAEALANKADKLGPELAEQCRRIMIQRIEACRMNEGVDREFSAGWQDRSTRLYEAAAAAAKMK